MQQPRRQHPYRRRRPLRPRQQPPHLRLHPKAAPAPAANGSAVVSPMPGSILDVRVKPGDAVAEGQVVVTLEAMKMEIEVKAESAGVVSAVNVKKGDMVESGSVLVTL